METMYANDFFYPGEDLLKYYIYDAVERRHLNVILLGPYMVEYRYTLVILSSIEIIYKLVELCNLNILYSPYSSTLVFMQFLMPFLIIWIDRKLELYNESDLDNQTRMVKLIHDIQNPITSINISLSENNHSSKKTKYEKDDDENNSVYKLSKSSIINYDYLDYNLDENIKSDLENIQLVINNMRSDIRTRNDFNSNESMKTIIVPIFFKSIIKSQENLAFNGNNSIQFQILDKNVPYKILIKKDAVKTIILNLISLSLRIIYKTIINIKIYLKDFDSYEYIKYKWTRIGTDHIRDQKYIVVEIKNSSLNFSFEDLDLLNVIKFNTFVHLCNQTNCFFYVNSQSNIYRLYIPYDNHNQLKYCDFIDEYYPERKIKPVFNNYDYTYGTAIIVEDSVNILKLYGKFMESEGLPCKLFSNGKEALNYINNIRINNDSIVLIYTDLNMPYMDGHQLANKCRNLNINYKIVLISAEDNYNNNPENIFDEIYIKPIDKKTFLNIYYKSYPKLSEYQIKINKHVSVYMNEDANISFI